MDGVKIDLHRRFARLQTPKSPSLTLAWRRRSCLPLVNIRQHLVLRFFEAERHCAGAKKEKQKASNHQQGLTKGAHFWETKEDSVKPETNNPFRDLHCEFQANRSPHPMPGNDRPNRLKRFILARHAFCKKPEEANCADQATPATGRRSSPLFSGSQ